MANGAFRQPLLEPGGVPAQPQQPLQAQAQQQEQPPRQQQQQQESAWLGSGGLAAACLRATLIIVGAGTFLLPWAFEQMGLLCSSLVVVTAAFLSRRCLSELLRARSAATLGVVPPAPQPQDPWQHGPKPKHGRSEAGLAELAGSILGASGGQVTRILLILRAAGVAAVHAAVAATALQLAFDESDMCSSSRGHDRIAGHGASHSQHAAPPSYCRLTDAVWLAVLLLVVLPLLGLGSRRLALLGLGGVLALFAAAAAALLGGVRWPLIGDFGSATSGGEAAAAAPLLAGLASLRRYAAGEGASSAALGGGSGAAGDSTTSAAVAAAVATTTPALPLLRSLPLLPPSWESLTRGLGVAVLLFWGHLAVLPPVFDAMSQPAHFGRVATASFVLAVIANLALGFFAAPLIPSTGGGSAEAAAAVSVTGLSKVGRALLGGGCASLCPAVLSPAVEQVRRLAPRSPRWASCIGLMGLVAMLAKVGAPGEVAGLIGGSVQCLLGIVLPSLLALGTLPFQSKGQTALRVVLCSAGSVLAALSVVVAFRGLLHRS